MEGCCEGDLEKGWSKGLLARFRTLFPESVSCQRSCFGSL
jgi:hypothetical protein